MILATTLFFIIGGGMTYLCRRELRLSWASRRWPHTTGAVCGREVHEGTTQGLSTDGVFAPEDRSFREIDLVYTYLVAGKRYQSSAFNFSAMGWQENTQYYDDGDEVTVYYCPADPSIAVLQPGTSYPLLIGPAFMATAVGCFLYGLFVR